jgi:hypothetical protein
MHLDTDKSIGAVEWPSAINRALRPRTQLMLLALRPGPAASGARILPHQLPITIRSQVAGMAGHAWSGARGVAGWLR